MTPDGIHTRLVATDRADTFVRHDGRTDGEVVVLVHGNISSSVFWEDTLLALPEGFRGLAPEGQPVEMEATGLLARCFQHEIDHLHGRLFLDYFGAFKKRSAMAAWEKEKAKYPALRRTLVAAKDLAEQHNEEAL